MPPIGGFIRMIAISFLSFILAFPNRPNRLIMEMAVILLKRDALRPIAPAEIVSSLEYLC